MEPIDILEGRQYLLVSPPARLARYAGSIVTAASEGVDKDGYAYVRTPDGTHFWVLPTCLTSPRYAAEHGEDLMTTEHETPTPKFTSELLFNLFHAWCIAFTANEKRVLQSIRTFLTSEPFRFVIDTHVEAATRDLREQVRELEPQRERASDLFDETLRLKRRVQELSVELGSRPALPDVGQVTRARGSLWVEGESWRDDLSATQRRDNAAAYLLAAAAQLKLAEFREAEEQQANTPTDVDILAGVSEAIANGPCKCTDDGDACEPHELLEQLHEALTVVKAAREFRKPNTSTDVQVDELARVMQACHKNGVAWGDLVGFSRDMYLRQARAVLHHQATRTTGETDHG